MDKRTKALIEDIGLSTSKPMTTSMLARQIAKIENEMFKAAQLLDFEKATVLRDALTKLQNEAFKSAI